VCDEWQEWKIEPASGGLGQTLKQADGVSGDELGMVTERPICRGTDFDPAVRQRAPLKEGPESLVAIDRYTCATEQGDVGWVRLYQRCVGVQPAVG
jgi:hypothetical protein